uniref:Retrovirus-related Pol polyprotein from transposon TNT 1-94 n=1 Tax=Tanacetum cinerariifolium TaxID=118510 RepID=A0A699HUX9_TANCI|nr:retrovirus-related Pol polyprotein from transposon TNT 1-94 [Tanacetum cinerariifolium]GEY75567.1 retrovirus-related Pol polyprotein from transposon TNT 1-94 [Tanacetum cinerariifolium]
MIIKKDSEIVKVKVERKTLALQARRESSDEARSTSRSKDEEYAMTVRDFKKFLKRRGRFVRQPRNDKKTFQKICDDKKGKSDKKCFRCGDPNHLIGECPKPAKDKNQRAFVRGSWSDSGEEDNEKVNNKTCLVAQESSEICLRVDLEPDEWIKDSGCSKHMTSNRKLFSTYKAYNEVDGDDGGLKGCLDPSIFMLVILDLDLYIFILESLCRLTILCHHPYAQELESFLTISLNIFFDMTTLIVNLDEHVLLRKCLYIRDLQKILIDYAFILNVSLLIEYEVLNLDSAGMRL